MHAVVRCPGTALMASALSIAIRDRDQWLAERESRVGGSEVPTLFGVGYDTLRGMWEVKRGNLPRADIGDQLPVLLGHRLESGFAAVLRAVKGWRLRKSRRYLVHPDESLRLGCTLDFELLTDDAGWVPVELKVMDFSSFNDQFLETEVSGEYEPGLRQSLQLQTQLLITGKPYGFICVLISNRQIVSVRQEAHAAAQQEIVRRVREFWLSVDADLPPPFDIDKDLELMARTMTNLQTGLELNWHEDEEANAMIAEYGHQSAIEATATDMKERIRARLYLRLGAAIRARCRTGQVSAKLNADRTRKSLRITPRK